MTAQMLWVVFAVFVLGLFVGSNLGVVLMCVLRMAGGEPTADGNALLAQANGEVTLS